jgi:hypothetical protein
VNNVIQFSDLIQRKKLEVVPVSTVETGKDDLGNTVITADICNLEVNVYTSQDDGCMVVQIDIPSPDGSEQPTLRVYLNDTTLYDPQTESDSDSEKQGE